MVKYIHSPTGHDCSLAKIPWLKVHYFVHSYNPAKFDSVKFYRENGKVKNVWLFNIEKDPEEIIDLSDDYPEVRQLCR